ncbi:MAG: ABC transporter ATP-binding protein [Gammaproteobacteria bacterium]|nr:ABC transporter ATP-binding protein [Gammaproteobacteria bacterium]
MKKLIIIIALTSTNPAWSMDKISLILDWFINPDHGPILIAEENGYFAEQNLEVEIVPPADPSVPPKIVAAGEADLAISYQPQLHLQVAENLPLIRVGTLVATPLNCLLVLEDGPVKSIADLAGRKVGFSVAGVEEALLTAILRPHELDMQDVELVNVNWSLSPALMSNQVDAVIGAFRNFELNQMKLENVKGKCFYLEEEGLPPYDELIFIANSDTMDKSRIRRFIKAVEQGVQYIVNHPEKSWEIFASTSPELNDDLNRLAWFDTLPRFALRPAALDAGRYRDMDLFFLEYGLIPEPNPINRLAIDITEE